jgi:hypothetical protein
MIMAVKSARSKRRHKATAKPHYNSTARTLYLGNRVVRRLSRTAVNLELILVTFEEDGWPPAIDDPLSPEEGMDPIKRLHDALDRLNENQEEARIKFTTNGLGTGILWTILS